MKNKFLFPRISLIIPVYNADKFLDNCLNSIVSQTLKEIEIIIINDGSLDNSLAIIEKFQIKDDRIILINQTNMGVSSARNAGLELAKGEYIYFVDADDWLELNMLDLIYSKVFLTQTDILIFDYNRFENGQIAKYNLKLTEQEISIKENREQILRNFLNFKYHNALWNKLFNSNVIRINQLTFQKEIGWGEDLLFNLQVLLNSKKVKLISNCLYNYRVHPTSSWNQGKRDIILETNKQIISFEDYANKNHDIEALKVFQKERAPVYLNRIINFNIGVINRESSTINTIYKIKLNLRRVLPKYINYNDYNFRRPIFSIRLYLLKSSCYTIYAIFEILIVLFKNKLFQKL